LDGLISRRHRPLLKGELAADILYDLETEEAIKQGRIMHWIILEGEYYWKGEEEKKQ
jgi:hypothetical protein